MKVKIVKNHIYLCTGADPGAAMGYLKLTLFLIIVSIRLGLTREDAVGQRRTDNTLFKQRLTI